MRADTSPGIAEDGRVNGSDRIDPGLEPRPAGFEVRYEEKSIGAGFEEGDFGSANMASSIEICGDTSADPSPLRTIVRTNP